MAFDLSVYRSVDVALIGSPPDVSVGSPEFEAWEKACGAALLFDCPVGSGGAIHRLWSGPAASLGLPMLAALYEDGLQASGGTLEPLAHEVRSLVAYWVESVDGDEHVTHQIGARKFEVPLLVDLIARADSVLAAIQLATRIDGVVIIS